MSQHLLQTQYQGEPVTVMLGWDRPLGHYFLVIEREGADEPLYSNLDQADAFGMSVEDLQAVLAEHQIAVPTVMFEQIELDSMNRVGNRYVRYRTDGSVID